MPEPKILIFIDWFLPGYKAGGQIPSVANIIQLLHNKYSFYIFTRDTDLGDICPYPEIESNTWHEGQNAKIYYVSKSKLSIRIIKEIIYEVRPDIVYINSMFSFWFTLAPLFKLKGKNIKIVVAPRGMLGQGALIHKKIKKVLFLYFAKKTSLFKDVIWHASSEFEKQEIINYFGNNAFIKIASDLSVANKIDSIEKPKKIADECQFFFLSRISPKKNLMFCLDVLNRISKTKKIVFTVLGPIEDAVYWKEFNKATEKLHSNIIVDYYGEIPNSEIRQLLVNNFHFLFFPTLHENYGHVIFESLSAGCPVIISDQTPWRNLQTIMADQHFEISNQNSQITNQKSSFAVGWDLPLDKPEEFVKVIEYSAAMGQEEYDLMSRNAFNYAQAIINDPKVIEANRKLFE